MCPERNSGSQGTDQALVDSFLKGNEQAFNTLFLRYQERVYTLARRYVHDHDTADDIVQEVFLKVYNSLKDFRGESGFYTWLFRITVNMSLNVVRKRKLKNLISLDETPIEFVSDDENPQEAVELKELRQNFQSAVSKLPEKQRTVFILRYYEQLSYLEISQILKITEGGLKANYFHALRNIERAIKKSYKKG